MIREFTQKLEGCFSKSKNRVIIPSYVGTPSSIFSPIQPELDARDTRQKHDQKQVSAGCDLWIYPKAWGVFEQIQKQGNNPELCRYILVNI